MYNQLTVTGALHGDAIDRPPSLTELAAGRIRKDIIEGAFALGQPVSESMLAERYAISKSPVKLALVQLKSEGLVIIKPQKGSFVFTVTAEDVRALAGWRIAMEQAALTAACEPGPCALFERLDAVYENMLLARRNRDRAESFYLDALYHWTIVECSDNRYFMHSYQANIHIINALLFRLGSIPWEDPDRFEEHATLIEHLQAGDLAAAKALLAEHIGHLCDSDRIAGLHALSAVKE